MVVVGDMTTSEMEKLIENYFDDMEQPETT